MPNPTYHDMTPAIGQRVSVNFESVRINCQVRNVKSSYGRVRLLVAPESGSGEQWVEMSRLNVPAPLNPRQPLATACPICDAGLGVPCIRQKTWESAKWVGEMHLDRVRASQDLPAS